MGGSESKSAASKDTTSKDTKSKGAVKQSPKPTPKPKPMPESAADAAARLKLHVERYNVLLAGASGVGKSSLANALRGLKAGDEGAAKPSGVGQSTLELRGYPFARAMGAADDSVWLHDVPGGATPEFPAATWCT